MTENNINFVVINWSNLNEKPLQSNLEPTIKTYCNLEKYYWIENNDAIYNKNVGNVGIGVFIPQYKLDINGSINANYYYQNGTNFDKIYVSSNSLFSTILNFVSTDLITTGTSNRFITNDAYLSNVTFCNIIGREFIKNGVNLSNIFVSSNVFFNQSNNLNTGINNLSIHLNNLNTDSLIIGTSNRFFTNDTYLSNVTFCNITGREFLKAGVNLSNIFISSNVFSNQSNNLNIGINNLTTRLNNLNTDSLIIGTSNRFFTNDAYLSNVTFCNISGQEFLKAGVNLSNIFISSNVFSNQSNNLNYSISNLSVRLDNLNTDTIIIGTSNRFITNNEYLTDITFGNVNASEFSKAGINISNIFITNDLYSNNSNSLFTDIDTRLNDLNTDSLVIGTNNRFITNNTYLSNVTFCNITGREFLKGTLNLSNIFVSSNVFSNQSNNLNIGINNLTTRLNNLNTDSLIIGTSNRFITNDAYLSNVTFCNITAREFLKAGVNLSNIFVTSNVFSNQSNNLNSGISNLTVRLDNLNTDSIIIGTNNRFITNNEYLTDITFGNVNATEFSKAGINISNIFITNDLYSNNSNNLFNDIDTRLNNLNTDSLIIGTNNRFITNDTYLSNVTFCNITGREFLKAGVNLSNIFVSSNVFSNQSNNLNIGINNLTTRLNNLNTDTLIIGTSNRFITNDAYLSNVTFCNITGREFLKAGVNLSNIFVSSNVFSNQSNNLNSGISNLSVRLDNLNTDTIIIGTNNRFITNNEYLTDITFGNVNATEFSNAGINISNIFITSNSFNNLYLDIINNNNDNSNNISSIINNLNTDTIKIGNSNKFIVNNRYDENVNFTKILNASNIITSNIYIIGESYQLNVEIKTTDQYNIINYSTGTALTVTQSGNAYNVAEFYDNGNNTALIIDGNGNIGINTNSPNYKLDINGNINSINYFKGGENISNIFVTSNVLFNQSNNLNTSIFDVTTRFNNLTTDIITIGTSNRFFTNDAYLSNVTFCNITGSEFIKAGVNISNIFVTSNVFSNQSNNLNTGIIDITNRFNNLTTDIITIGTSNRFFTNNALLSNVTFCNITGREFLKAGVNLSNIFITSNVFSNQSNNLNTNIFDITTRFNNLTTDIITIGTSNRFFTNDAYLSNVTFCNITGREFIKGGVNLSNIFVSSNVFSNQSNNLNTTINNLTNRFNNLTTDIITIGNSNRFFTNDAYLSNVTFCNITGSEFIKAGVNLSNIFVTSNVFSNQSNNLNVNINNLTTRFNNLTTDIITIGTSNRFFTNDAYLSNVTFCNITGIEFIKAGVNISNIFVTSNVFSNQSNNLNTSIFDITNRFNNLTTDIITIGTSNRFITNDAYLSNVTFCNITGSEFIKAGVNISNIFVSSNVFSNQSNNLNVNINNLTTRFNNLTTDIITIGTSNRFFTNDAYLSNVTFCNITGREFLKAGVNLSNIFVSSNVLSNQSNNLNTGIIDVTNRFNNLTTDIITIGTSNRFFTNNAYLSNVTFCNITGSEFIKTGVNISNIFVTSNVFSNQSNNLNTGIIDVTTRFNNLTTDIITIGTSNRFITNNAYLSNVTFCNITGNEYIKAGVNISNIFVTSNVFSNQSNNLNANINNLTNSFNNLTTDIITIGTSNRFITNNAYLSNVTFCNITGNEYIKAGVNISNIFVTSNVFSNQSNNLNTGIIDVTTRFNNLTTDIITIGTSNRFITNDAYLSNVTFCNITGSEYIKAGVNISNIFVTSNVFSNQSNNLYSNLFAIKQNNLTSNTILSGIGSNITNINYNNIIYKPTYFQTDWLSTIDNLPTYFQTDWNNTIDNLPYYFKTDWLSTIDNRPTLFDGTWSNLSGKPARFPSDWNTTINKPTTDTLTIGTSNRFITNDIYSRKISLSNIVSSNITTSNLIITGNLGIGITNPNEKIEISGNIIATDYFKSGINISNIFVTSNVNSNQLLNINNIINQNYCKKTSFYFIPTNSYIYSGTTYYTYNIQLSKYISYIPLNNYINLYKFRIHASFFDSSFNDNTIRECDYLIMISDRNINDANKGINVRALGLPQDIYLQKFAPWKFIKNSNFDYITYISPIQNASILCTIIDEL